LILNASEIPRDLKRVYPEELLEEVLHQIEKDFNRAGLEIEKLDKPKSLDELINKLAEKIKQLTTAQTQQLLYAVDLNEASYLSVQSNPTALCELIVKRILQKVVWRKKGI
jgi:hypothetical protein